MEVENPYMDPIGMGFFLYKETKCLKIPMVKIWAKVTGFCPRVHQVHHIGQMGDLGRKPCHLAVHFVEENCRVVTHTHCSLCYLLEVNNENTSDKNESLKVWRLFSGFEQTVPTGGGWRVEMYSLKAFSLKRPYLEGWWHHNNHIADHVFQVQDLKNDFPLICSIPDVPVTT